MNSELEISSNCYNTEKAWHLASILLFLRRPASTIELAERCSLFRISPDFVEFLCSIPNSPICLIADDFVMLSMSMFNAFGEFVASSLPKVEFQVHGGERMLRSCDDLVYSRKRKKLGNEMMPAVKKRAVLSPIYENEREIRNLIANRRAVSTCLKGYDLKIAHPDGGFSPLTYNRFLKAVNMMNTADLAVTSSVMNSSIRRLDYPLKIIEDQERANDKRIVVKGMDKFVTEEYQYKSYANETLFDLPIDHEDFPPVLLSEKIAEFSALLVENYKEPSILVSGMSNEGPLCVEPSQHGEKLSLESTAVLKASNNCRNSQMQEIKLESMSEQPLIDTASPEEKKVENFSVGSFSKGLISAEIFSPTITEISSHKTDVLNEDLTKNKQTSQPMVDADPHSIAQKLRKEPSDPKSVPQVELTHKQQTPSKLTQNNTIDVIQNEQKDKKLQKSINPIAKSKHMTPNNVSIQERRDNAHKSSKDQQKPNFPEFEAYTVEQEEGSGGYGTVYRAKRKTDGMTFAIKCPHENAQKHHVKNEYKMLQRYGGKNYVIKLECSLKSEDSDCFVLQHVEHDRPEVLKKMISISQLQWYGYCMFKALVGLHKQGVFHRDIKPGNFLFSSKTLTGYLIDFNLAKDTNQIQKHGYSEKLLPKGVITNQQNPLVHSKSISPDKLKKNQGAKFSSFKEAAISGSNRVIESKMVKKKVVNKVKAYDDIVRCNSLTSQGADVSSITSTKDMTSTRTPSVERFRDRQPLPSKGRKALINLAQEAMQNPNIGTLKAPASNRKRVAASPGITNRKLIYPTPTPLHFSGTAISGAGALNNRGDAKPIKDGPCVGTKGFRAPEVLLRSLYQGPKIDVWSAGVTLLYLISGKLPFNGDPEQNMKEIIGLKGNEELWEVAKLHNRESSLPVELLDINFLPSMTVRKWYSQNTRRPDLLDVIPDSLFDLLEKCLTVNPRLRISAEEALNHEFFLPCHVPQKRRSLRHEQSPDSKSTLMPLLCEPVRTKRETS